MALNLGSLLATSARRSPNAVAARTGSEELTYAELDVAARSFASELIETGIEPGSKVALMLPNVPEFTIAYFGVLYAGGVVVPLSTLHVADELAFQLGDCEATTFVVHADCASAAFEAFGRTESCRNLYVVDGQSLPETPGEAKPFEQALDRSAHADVAQTRPDDTSVILYTSGTTGHPKGAELSHFNLFYNAQYISEKAFSLWPDEINVLGGGHVGLAVLPLYHTFGQTNVQNGMFFNGGTVSYVKRFTPEEAVEIIERHRVTFFAGVPTMYFALLNCPEAETADLSSLKFCVSGGAPMPVDVKREFYDRFGFRIQEGYGLTETSPLASVQAIDETAKAGTIGKPIPGVDMKIVDASDEDLPAGERGEVLIRGHNVMKGYFKRPEATDEALRGGWFHSGDIGYVDDEGDFHIVDRSKDMILRGGYNVFPREVEEVLYTHPSIIEAAVIGVPHERLGEDVKAVVALKPGSSTTPDEIAEYCKEHLAAYKYPRTVEIIDELPKGPTGKILKRALKESP